MMRPVHAVAASLLLLGLVGCGGSDSTPADPLPRRAVSGTVTLDGKPLPAGKIQLEPSTPGSNQPTASADINDGKFSIERPLGPVPGKYRVSISGIAAFKIAPDQEPGTRPKPQPDPVPAKYNTKSTLSADVLETPSSELKFDLVSK